MRLYFWFIHQTEPPMKPVVLPFKEIDNTMIHLVGGKNASLGEMFSRLGGKGVQVPDGFAITTAAFNDFIAENQLEKPIRAVLVELDTIYYTNLGAVGERIRALISKAEIPSGIANDIRQAYRILGDKSAGTIQVAVRSSATAEDLVSASFAGQHESFLNIRSEVELLQACLDCYASLYTDRAIKYRNDHGFDHMKVALSVGVQRMIRSDLACSGVCFTIDPDSGHTNVMLVTGGWGLGENIVLGNVNPDEYYVFKPSIGKRNAVLSRKVGEKSETMVYSELPGHRNTVNVPTPPERRTQLTLNDDEVNRLAAWASIVEEHYGRAMDIEWAKDGLDNGLYIVQARPVTALLDTALTTVIDYRLDDSGPVLCWGYGIGHRIVSGTARVVLSPRDAPADLGAGDILITDITSPDWDPIRASPVLGVWHRAPHRIGNGPGGTLAQGRPRRPWSRRYSDNRYHFARLGSDSEKSICHCHQPGRAYQSRSHCGPGGRRAGSSRYQRSHRCDP
ncbi:hypothetical protein GBK04_00545 [Cytophagaceae bacterium SJW1-29]|uniref:Phosphoenolpyruvate synthase n=1 Tax=Salmonirosea aquatica TaxID=2654236 RepID=A0A7C9BEE9_9BACT|nr:hypothetical protein [Cytophagaceae bacterium SJW1-29]